MTFAEMQGIHEEIQTCVNTARSQGRPLRESELVRTLWAAQPKCPPAFISRLVDESLKQCDPARMLPETVEEAGVLMRHQYNGLEGLVTSLEEKVTTPAEAQVRELGEKWKAIEEELNKRQSLDKSKPGFCPIPRQKCLLAPPF